VKSNSEIAGQAGSEVPVLEAGTDDAANLPLSGIRIADFSRLLPGPWCTQFLSDLGATVIKVERPDVGDMSRHNPPVYETSSVYFNSVNGGKDSLAIDLSSADGKAVAHKLIATCDVLVESFRPGVTTKLGIDYEQVKPLNPDIIYCSVTGFGQSGPLSHISGHDLVIQALAGFAGLSSAPGTAPQVPGFQAADYAGATTACIGILSALLKRTKCGEGSYLDIAMFDSLFAMCNISQTSAMARMSGNTGEPELEVWGGNPRYCVYSTADGKAVALALLETRLWAGFCDAIERPDLIDENETPDARHSNHGAKAQEYRKAITDFCLSKNRDDLIEELTAHGVPVCPIYSPDEALNSANVAGRGLIEHIEHPTEGKIPQLANPLSLSGLTRRRRSAPRLGGSSETILDDLGFDSETRKQLFKKGVVQP